MQAKSNRAKRPIPGAVHPQVVGVARTVPRRWRALLPTALQSGRRALECAEEPGEAALWYPVTKNLWMVRHRGSRTTPRVKVPPV